MHWAAQQALLISEYLGPAVDQAESDHQGGSTPQLAQPGLWGAANIISIQTSQSKHLIHMGEYLTGTDGEEKNGENEEKGQNGIQW